MKEATEESDKMTDMKLTEKEIEILDYLNKNKGSILPGHQIAKELNANFGTTLERLQKLRKADLVTSVHGKGFTSKHGIEKQWYSKEEVQTLQRSLVEEVLGDLKGIEHQEFYDSNAHYIQISDIEGLITKWKQRLEDK